MNNLEMKVKSFPDFLEAGQLYSAISKDMSIRVNGSVTVTGNIPDYVEDSKVRVYCNLCDANGRILYVLNDYNSIDIFKNNYFVFSMDCYDITRFLSIKDLKYAEIYVIFKDKDCEE